MTGTIYKDGTLPKSISDKLKSESEQPGVFSAVDISAYITLLNKEKSKVKLDTLVMINISSHRDKYPVTSCGKIRPKAFTKGHQTNAGSLVFHVGTKNAFYDILSLAQPMDKAHTITPDDLPPFDIVITCVNEMGDAALISIHGIELLDSGSMYSLDGINILEQYSFMATSITPMQPAFNKDTEGYESTSPQLKPITTNRTASNITNMDSSIQNTRKMVLTISKPTVNTDV